MNHKQFFWGNIGFATGAIAVVGSVNFLTDPYSLIGIPLFSNKSISENHQRLVKSVEVVRVKPKTIILGTSRTRRLDSSHPIFDNVQPAYNLSLAGSSVYEQRRYLEHAIAYQPDLEVVVIGLDFFAFGADFNAQPGFIESRLGAQPRIQGITLEDFKNILFSVDSLSNSWKTISENILPSNSYSSSQNENSRSANFIRNSEIVLKSYLERSDRYYGYKLDKDKIEEFRKIVEICNERDIRLIAIISPIHATQLETIYTAGLWQDFKEWKKRIVEVAPVWDFSGYNYITSEPLSDAAKNYEDPSHFRGWVGNLLLDKILANNSTNEFGVFLTSSNVNERNGQLDVEREKWVGDNRDDVQFVALLGLWLKPYTAIHFVLAIGTETLTRLDISQTYHPIPRRAQFVRKIADKAKAPKE